jgi:hypothetical protein
MITIIKGLIIRVMINYFIFFDRRNIKQSLIGVIFHDFQSIIDNESIVFSIRIDGKNEVNIVKMNRLVRNIDSLKNILKRIQEGMLVFRLVLFCIVNI